MNIELLYQHFLKSNGVTTDSRKVNDNQLYFALKGDNFNGNLFAETALSQGASLAIVDDKQAISSLNSEKYFFVDDVLETLQDLANHHRKQLNIPIISLTGSNGKTTTKELINIVVKQKFTTVATIGNLNNHIGVPLTLLSMTNETQLGIVEMGANHQKEIELLCKIAEPNYGYITNFGKAHLEGFGGIEGVIKGKSEMYDYLATNHKTVFVNYDDPIQVEKTNTIKRFLFGQNSNQVDINIQNIEANPNVKISFNNIHINTNLIGIYNASNICAAIAIGKYFDISDEHIKTAIESYLPNNNRSQIIEKDSNKIILDAYNANPSSMDVAITNLSQLTNTKKIAILGDMFELGEATNAEHSNIIKKVVESNLDKVYFVGQRFFDNQVSNPKIEYYKTLEDLKTTFKFTDFSNYTILIKGSRGMALERLL